MTCLFGRAARPSLHPGSRSLSGLIVLVALSLLVAGCGVKNDLIKPNGQSTPRDQPDPSKPPYPIGR